MHTWDSNLSTPISLGVQELWIEGCWLPTLCLRSPRSKKEWSLTWALSTYRSRYSLKDRDLTCLHGLRCVSEKAPCERAMCSAGQHAGEVVHAQGRGSDHMCPAAGEGEYLQVVEVLPLGFSWSSPPHYQSLSGLGRRKEGPPSHWEIADDQASSPCPSLTGDLRCHLSSLRYISTDRYHIVVEVIMWMSIYVEKGNSYDEQKGKSSDQWEG